MPRRLKQLSAEALAIVRQGGLLIRGDRPAAPVEGRRAVVFIHGYGARGPVFQPMRAHLERTLGVATLAFSYEAHQPFTRNAARFAALVDRVAGTARSVDIVAHSLGGLVARWYLQELGGAERVQRIVLLATPHAGTRAAAMARGGAREALRRDGAITRRLATGRARAESVAHTALVAGADLMVTPPASAAALEDADVRWFSEVGHNEMLFHSEVFDAVTKALSEPREE